MCYLVGKKNICWMFAFNFEPFEAGSPVVVQTDVLLTVLPLP